MKGRRSIDEIRVAGIHSPQGIGLVSADNYILVDIIVQKTGTNRIAGTISGIIAEDINDVFSCRRGRQVNRTDCLDGGGTEHHIDTAGIDPLRRIGTVGADDHILVTVTVDIADRNVEARPVQQIDPVYLQNSRRI